MKNEKNLTAGYHTYFEFNVKMLYKSNTKCMYNFCICSPRVVIKRILEFVKNEFMEKHI